jgi:hypothetical protein
MNQTIDYTNFEQTLSKDSIEYLDRINVISAIKKAIVFINEYSEEKFLEYADVNNTNDLKVLIHFILQYGENNIDLYFSKYNKESVYVSFDILDTFISQYGLEYIQDCTRLYQGKYTNEIEFAKQYLREDVDSLYHYANEYLHYYLDIDINWKDTSDNLFNEDFVFLNGYVFSNDY